MMTLQKQTIRESIPFLLYWKIDHYILFGIFLLYSGITNNNFLNSTHAFRSNSLSSLSRPSSLHMVAKYDQRYDPLIATVMSDPDTTSSKPLNNLFYQQLSGSWLEAKDALNNPKCCVVSIKNLENHLVTLRQIWDQQAVTDLDLRLRVNLSTAYEDCLKIRRIVSPFDNEEEEDVVVLDDPATNALKELALGVLSFAHSHTDTTDNISNKRNITAVYMRVVCASNYCAHDPMFHTDKAPLRGYVTLFGPGTDFRTKPCSILEYIKLRTLGTTTTSNKDNHSDFSQNAIDHDRYFNDNDLRRAKNLEFIIMKGDYYYPMITELQPTLYYDGKDFLPSLRENISLFFNHFIYTSQLWTRAYGCIHRSPPATTSSRRMILSLDLANGDDDREWCDLHMKRKWRSGMTQRKSRLVA